MQTTNPDSAQANALACAPQSVAADAGQTAQSFFPTLLPGERYAGIVVDAAGVPTHHLVLLLAQPDQDLTWQAAMDWATNVGGFLPTRQEQSLLFANCKAHLQPEWHWSCEEYAGNASYAWDCHFYFGNQVSHHKSYDGSVVAVRRLPINPSVL